MRSFLIVAIVLVGTFLTTSLHAAELYGHVTNHGGNPIGGTDVELQDSHGRCIDNTKTNPNGYYSFKNIDPGSYQLKVRGRTRTVYVGPGEIRRDFRLK